MSQPRVGESTNSFSNTNNSFNVYNPYTFGTGTERDMILAWLSPLEPRIRHHDIRARRVEDVGGWLLRTEEYQNWFHGIRSGEPDNSALFCYGDPGVGKTYISSLVVDRLGDCARGQSDAIACFYFDFAAPKKQSPTSVLGSLLKQVIGGLKNIPAKIVDAFRNQRDVLGGRVLTLDEIIDMFQDISTSRPTFLCIDALEECMAEYRPKLLDSLKRILHKSPSTRVFLTGRLDIRGEVEKHLGGRVVAVCITPPKADIIRFLREKLKEDTAPDAMDKSLKEDIIKNMLETVSEIFLLVSLNIKAILQETTVHRRREKLDTMTNGLVLRDAYDATIGRIMAQERGRARLGVAALMWISHSERPLSVDEICHALGVEIGSTDVNLDNVPSIWTVLGCCHGLATVDNGSSTVRLIHFTLKEYLSRHADLFPSAHSTIAESCLTHLNFQAIKALSASRSRNPRSIPLLEYSSLYWGTHMRIEVSDRSRCLALELLNQYENHISAELLWNSTGEWSFAYVPKPFSALHCISYFGIAEVAADLIRTKRWDVNQRDSAGLTPLIWAARHGCEEVVELLLQQKHTQPDMPDTIRSRTALSWAAGSGHEGVVRLFLGRLFINPGSIGRRWGKAPQGLSLLFGRKYVNPDRADRYGQTALSWAARNGHHEVMKLLLGRKDVNPDSPDEDGQTAFSWAVRNGHEEVMKLLLGRGDVSPNISDNYGMTPLSWVARNGHDGAVILLLGRGDVSPDRPDNGGQTPLSWAAKNGRDGVVKLLLGREDVSPDRPNNYGRTPLSLAAGNGRDGVVKLLLRREDVSPDRPDNNDRTALSWASENGHDGVVRLLLGREDVSPNTPDKGGQTPLSWAARNGYERVVWLLLARNDVCHDRPDDDGRAPLSWAAKNGHDGIVKRLLEREGTTPDRPDNRGRTPLLWAASNGHDEIVKLLLEREDVTPDRLDNYGGTPLLLAAKNKRDQVVKLLLGREDVSPDRSDNHYMTPLWYAVKNRRSEVVKMLLERQDIYPNRPDCTGQTPLSWAAENGHYGLVKLLLGREDINPDKAGSLGQTPLSLATWNGHDRIVKLLKARKAATRA